MKTTPLADQLTELGAIITSHPVVFAYVLAILFFTVMIGYFAFGFSYWALCRKKQTATSEFPVDTPHLRRSQGSENLHHNLRQMHRLMNRNHS